MELPKNTIKLHEIVDIKLFIPNIKYYIKYATNNNFTHKKIYNSQEQNLKLQYQAIKKLIIAEELAQKQGFSLKIRDAYRPDEAQESLRKSYDDVGLPQTHKIKNIAKPISLGGKGSNHSKGIAIDITLTDLNGKELEMPTNFDEFGNTAHWTHVNKLPNDSKKKQNALKLKEIMTKAGFTTYENERRHFQSLS